MLRSAGFLVEVISVLNVLLIKVFKFLEARIISDVIAPFILKIKSRLERMGNRTEGEEIWVLWELHTGGPW